MNARNLSKSLLVAVFALSCASLAVADPIICEPDVAIAPPGETSSGGWFAQLFDAGGKPQAFQGAVGAEAPADDCQSASDAISIVGNLSERDLNQMLD